MIRFLFLFLVGFVIAQERPKLVVGIVVDQMKAEYLYRFQNDYSNGGFKRLMENGYEFKNAQYNYIPTYTAPGHASIYTGTTPNNHGIVGNTWFHKTEEKRVYCTGDEHYKTVGDQSIPEAGEMSPHRLESTTITDELKLSLLNKGKVIGISVKDRGAILPAGHFANSAFWMNDNGNFISSSFYAETLPKWVLDYNKQNKAQSYINQGWDLLLPEENYTESLKDNNPYERIFKPKTTPTFPYNLKEIQKEEGTEIIKTTPYGNNMVAELAIKAIESEQLGKDEFTDFLAISFSSTDYVGHSFGPTSKELQDTYIRLDRTLEEFLNVLDKTVGKGNYLLFLTADHAAAEVPKYLKDIGYNDVESLSHKKFQKELNDYLKEKYGKNLIQDYYNQNIFLDEKKIQKEDLDYKKVVQSVVDYGMKKNYIKRIYTRKEILSGNVNDDLLNLIAKGYDVKQSGDLVVLLKPAYMEFFETGTTHGSGYSYDTHVPLLFYGWNIPKGKTVKKKSITQIAPTLSILLSVNFPNASDPNILTELFE